MASKRKRKATARVQTAEDMRARLDKLKTNAGRARWWTQSLPAVRTSEAALTAAKRVRAALANGQITPSEAKKRLEALQLQTALGARASNPEQMKLALNPEARQPREVALVTLTAKERAQRALGRNTAPKHWFSGTPELFAELRNQEHFYRAFDSWAQREQSITDNWWRFPSPVIRRQEIGPDREYDYQAMSAMPGEDWVEASPTERNLFKFKFKSASRTGNPPDKQSELWPVKTPLEPIPVRRKRPWYMTAQLPRVEEWINPRGDVLVRWFEGDPLGIHARSYIIAPAAKYNRNPSKSRWETIYSYTPELGFVVQSKTGATVFITWDLGRLGSAALGGLANEGAAIDWAIKAIEHHGLSLDKIGNLTRQRSGNPPKRKRNDDHEDIWPLIESAIGTAEMDLDRLADTDREDMHPDRLEELDAEWYDAQDRLKAGREAERLLMDGDRSGAIALMLDAGIDASLIPDQ